MIKMDGFDDAIVGVFFDETLNCHRVCYGYHEMIDVMVDNGSTHEEAVEYIDFNILGSIPEYGPVILHILDEGMTIDDFADCIGDESEDRVEIG